MQDERLTEEFITGREEEELAFVSLKWTLSISVNKGPIHNPKKKCLTGFGVHIYHQNGAKNVRARERQREGVPMSDTKANLSTTEGKDRDSERNQLSCLILVDICQ